MKKIFLFILTLLLILIIILFGLFLIIKNELKTEKIKERINEIGVLYDYSINMKDLNYDLSFEGLLVEIDSLSILSDNIKIYSDISKIKINIFALLKKTLVFEGIYMEDAIINIRKKEDNKSGDEKKSVTYPDIKFVKIKNAELVYDTFCFYDINAEIFFDKGEKLSIVGNMDFNAGFKKLKMLGKIRSNFNIILDSVIDIKKLIIKNNYGVNLYLNGYIDTIRFVYNTKILAKNTDIAYKMGLLDSNKIKSNGITNIYISGFYDYNMTLEDNCINNIDSFYIQMSKFDVYVDTLHLGISEKLNIVKQNDILKLSGIIDYKNKKFNIISNIVFENLFNRELNFDFLLNHNMNELYTLFYNNDKLFCNGNVEIKMNGLLVFDSLNSIDYIKHNMNGNMNFKQLVLKYDTLMIYIDNGKFAMNNGMIKGIFLASRKNNKFIINTYYDLSKELLSGDIKGKVYISDFLKDIQGQGKIEGNIIYSVKNSILNGKFKGNLYNVYSKSINDTFTINTAKILIDKKGLKLFDIFLKGNYLQSYLEEADIKLNKQNICIDAKINVEFASLDSLFPIKNDDAQKNKDNVKIVFDDKWDININGKIKKAIFRDEHIENGEYILSILNGELIIKDFKAELLNGKVSGNVRYFPNNNYLIKMNINTENLDIESFNNKHKIFPYAIGGNVKSKSSIDFNQFNMQSTINGKVYVEIDNGWMENPQLFKNLSKLIRHSLSDTFYFDEMIGEFNIKDELVSFEDFYMNKYGHSLLYSGNVDFDKNLYIEGKYIINMKYADIGFMEGLLKKVGYDADTIFIKFELLGDYKLPVVEIKDNSINRYFKNKTDEFFRNLF